TFASSWFQGYANYLYALMSSKPDPPSITQKMIDDATELWNNINNNDLSVIPCPKCGPSLSITNLQIQGLANVEISGDAPSVTQSDAGYQFTIKLDFNAYPSDDSQWNRQLQLTGLQQGTGSSTKKGFFGFNFQMTQCLVFEDANENPIPLPAGVDEPPSRCD